METYSFGLTPREVLESKLPDIYEMKLNDSDFEVFKEVVNIGIDSHLEACYVPSRGDRINPNRRKVEIQLSKESMLCLLRRLNEYDEEYADPDCRAAQLRQVILCSIGIEEI